MTDGVLGFALPTLAAALASGGERSGGARAGGAPLTGGLAPYNTYLSKDGHPMALAALEPKFWAPFCEGAGLEPDPSALVPGPHQAELKRSGRAAVRGDARRVGDPRRRARLLPRAGPRSAERSQRIPTSPRAISCSRSPRRAADPPAEDAGHAGGQSRSRRRLGPASIRARVLRDAASEGTSTR